MPDTVRPEAFNPDEGTGSTPLLALSRAIEARAPLSRSLILHPRRDNLWVLTGPQGYRLSIRKGRGTYPLSDQALAQLSAQLDVSQALLRHLQEMEGKEKEDARLLNKLLWHKGADPAFSLRFTLRSERVTEVFSSAYTPLPLDRLLQGLRVEEARGGPTLQRFTLNEPSGFRLVFVHPSAPPVPLHHSQSQGQTHWRAGAILTNTEDGRRAIMISPALISPDGTRTLPLLEQKRDVHRRIHRATSSDQLVDDVIREIRSTAGAPFVTLGKRFISLNRLRIAADQGPRVLEAMDLPLDEEIRGAALRSLASGKSSQYWLVHRLLESVGTLGITERFGLETRLARLVWIRGTQAT